MGPRHSFIYLRHQPHFLSAPKGQMDLSVFSQWPRKPQRLSVNSSTPRLSSLPSPLDPWRGVGPGVPCPGLHPQIRDLMPCPQTLPLLPFRPQHGLLTGRTERVTPPPVVDVHNITSPVYNRGPIYKSTLGHGDTDSLLQCALKETQQ